MVFLVISSPGLRQLSEALGHIPSPLWVGAGVLSEDHLMQLRASGAEVTEWCTSIIPDDHAVLDDILVSIREHHPGQHIWVEHIPHWYGADQA